MAPAYGSSLPNNFNNFSRSSVANSTRMTTGLGFISLGSIGLGARFGSMIIGLIF